MFHIPSNRITKKPMIYPEFRLHSIIFAYRSIVVMLLMYFKVQSYWRAITVISTLILADLATLYTRTSSTTMRGMPFDERIPPLAKSAINFFYSVSQVLATLNMMDSDTIDKPFIILFPIQIAAFLMTCVRKGFLSANGWHVLYAASLGMNYVHAFYIRSSPTAVSYSANSLHEYCAICAFFCFARFYLKINKYILWLIISARYALSVAI